jgi:hypothetical protein
MSCWLKTGAMLGSMLNSFSRRCSRGEKAEGRGQKAEGRREKGKGGCYVLTVRSIFIHWATACPPVTIHHDREVSVIKIGAPA